MNHRNFHRRVTSFLAPIFSLFLAAPLTAQTSPKATCTPIRTFTAAAGTQFLAPDLSPDGSRLSVLTTTGLNVPAKIAVYDVATGQPLFEWTAPPKESINWTSTYRSTFSPDGTKLAVVTSKPNFHSVLQVFDLSAKVMVYTHELSFGFDTAHFLPDGQLLHTHAPDRKVDDAYLCIVNIATGQTTGQIKVDRMLATPQYAFPTDRTQLLLGDGENGAIIAWNPAAGAQVSKLDMQPRDIQYILTYLPNSHTLRGVNGQGVIQTWDTDTGKRLSRTEPPAPLHLQPGTLSFLPNGQTFIIALPNTLEFRDAQSGRPIGHAILSPDPASTVLTNDIRADRLVITSDADHPQSLTVLQLPDIKSPAPSPAR